MARHELEAAQQLRKLCAWYEESWESSGPEQVLRNKVLQRALRAAHLDPTSEEAARLVVLGIDSPYWLRGNGRSRACYDRIISEGQQYLDRFVRNPNAAIVRQHISGIAFQQLSEMRQGGGGEWSRLPFNIEIWRYAKVALLSMDLDIRDRQEMNLWADANQVGGCILMHCPTDRLEEERTYWHDYWKKNIEPLNVPAASGMPRLDAPTWDFVELYYDIRKKDTAALRQQLCVLARTYPRSHQNMWWGTRMWEGQPAWKARVQNLLKQGGDPDWKTWEPPFANETFDWSPQAYDEFLGRYNPSMPQAWDIKNALPFPTDPITVESDHRITATVRNKGLRPLLSAGGFMWLCQPAPGEDLTTRRNLLLIPMDRLQVDGKNLHVKAQTIPWPIHPSDAQTGVPGQAVRCWLTTVVAK